MCFFGAKHQTPFETIKIPQFWHIGDLFRPFRLAAMTIFPEKGRISEMAIFAFVDFTKILKITKLTFFENFKQFLGSSPISICILRGPGWFFTKNLDHPIFPSEIAWMPSYINLNFCVIRIQDPYCFITFHGSEIHKHARSYKRSNQWSIMLCRSVGLQFRSKSDRF